MVAAYLRADRFDVLSRVVYDWRLRAEGTSTGQQKHDLANLLQRIAVKATARDLVWREASPAVQAAWVGRVLDIDFPPYVEKALDADENYRRALQQALQTYVGLATREAWSHVRVRQKVRTYLASQGAWEVLATAERVFDDQGSIPPTAVRDGSVVLKTSPTAGTAVTIPDDLLELAASESRLQVCLSSCERSGTTSLRLTGWAVIRAVDLSNRRPSIKLWLWNESKSRRLDVSVTELPTPEATAWVGWRHGSFEPAGFEATIDLVDATSAPAAWRLCASVEVDGVIRQGGVHDAVSSSSASRDALRLLKVRVGKSVVRPGMDRQHGFGFW